MHQPKEKESSLDSPSRKSPKSPKKPAKTHAISAITAATFSPRHLKSPSSINSKALKTSKTGAFPENLEEELRRRGIKDLKIFEFLSQISLAGLNSQKPKQIYCWDRNSQKPGLDFHSFCDGQAPLLFLCVFHSGFMLGGYIYAVLDASKRILKDKLAGLFSFFGEKAYFYEINEQEVRYEEEGFSLGVPQNLFVNLDFIDESRCAQELKFKSPLGSEITFKIATNFVWSLMIKQIFAYKLS